MTPEDELLFEDLQGDRTAKRSGIRKNSAVSQRASKVEGDGRSLTTSATVVALADPHVVILASAGTGKTFQLTNRYLTLLRSGSCDRILASTFTRKAAGEILDRILVRLAKAILDEAELTKLQPFLGSPAITRDECITLLQRVTKQLHRVQISTLDALFSKLASSHTFELGFPPGWRMIEEVEAGRLTDRAIEAVLRKGGRQDAWRLMHLLSKGENSRRVHDLIRETVRNFAAPYLITQEADWNRLPDLPLLNELELNGAIAVFESLRFDDKRIMNALDKNRRQLREDDWDSFLSDGLPLRLVTGETTYYKKELPTELLAAYAPLIHHAKALFYKVWASQTRGTWETLNRVYTELNRLKTEERVLDFGDISRTLAERLGEHAVHSVAFRLDTNMDHLLLDEFQDTSLDQWQILRPFAESTISSVSFSPRASVASQEAWAKAHATSGKSFFCVGDRKQAIYGWRGGEAAIFDTIQAEFPILQSRHLDRSQRSSPAVIEAVNAAFTSLRGTTDFDPLSEVISTWCEGFPLHDTARTGLPGYVRLEVADEPPKLEPVEGGDTRSVGFSPRVMGENSLAWAKAHATGNAKAPKPSKADLFELVLDLTADRIEEYAQRVPSATIGVLFRGNAAIRLLGNKLRARGLEFSEEGGTLITDSAAVQLLLSLLKIADHPGDRVARFHVATSPLAEIHQLGRWEDDAAAVAVSEHLRNRLLSDGYMATLQRWVLQLGAVTTEHDRSRLRQLIELAEGYQATTRPRDFIQLVETRKVENPTPARIQLMTVHKSKGLQFDIVFLADLDTSLVQPPKFLTSKPADTAPPDCVLVYRSKDLKDILPPELQVAYEQTQATDLTGNLCVLYVAMTRAVHALHMILPAKESASIPKTLAGLLLVGLGAGQAAAPGATLYETGDPLWPEQCPELQQPSDRSVGFSPRESVASEEASAKAHTTRAIEFAELTGGRRRGLERIIPSQLADQATPVKLTSVLPLGETVGVDRGTLFHAWLERIQWLEDGLPPDDQLRQIAAAQGAPHLDIESCLKQFHAQLQPPQIASVLSRHSGFAELAAGDVELDLSQERRLNVIDAGRTISGSIDRLVLIRRNGQVVAADIIDFKTDALIGDEETAVRDKVAAYRDQMQSYARAIALMYKLAPDRISTRLVMLAIGRVETVECGP